MHKGMVIWFTGLSGAGKTTIANALYDKLISEGKKAYKLDGDVMRSYFDNDLYYTRKDREKNLIRAAILCKILVENGIIVLATFISPYEDVRQKVKEKINKKFKLVYVNTSLECCKKRDAKGLYAKAISGEIKNFTGISDPYDVPLSPDVVIDTEKISIEENVNKILEVI